MTRTISRKEVVDLVKKTYGASTVRDLIQWGETESLGHTTASFDGFEIEVENPVTSPEIGEVLQKHGLSEV